MTHIIEQRAVLLQIIILLQTSFKSSSGPFHSEYVDQVEPTILLRINKKILLQWNMRMKLPTFVHTSKTVVSRMDSACTYAPNDVKIWQQGYCQIVPATFTTYIPRVNVRNTTMQSVFKVCTTRCRMKKIYTEMSIGIDRKKLNVSQNLEI